MTTLPVSQSALPGYRRFFFRGLVLHPIWRIIIYLIVMVVVELVAGFTIGILYGLVLFLTGASAQEVLDALTVGMASSPLLLMVGISRLVIALGLALLMSRFLDREPIETMGLEPTRGGKDTAVGLALGAGTMVLIGAVLLALNPQPSWPGRGDGWKFLLDAVALLPAAAAEEIAFRGYLQRALTTWRGPIVGVLVPSVLFALFHALNPNVSPLALVNIALAGAVFAVAAERTGTLWLPIAYHYAWNLTQGPVLGLPVSGMAWNGLLALPVGGPSWLTGGAFGPEGGLLSTAVLALSLLPLWALTRCPASLSGVARRQRAQAEREGALPFQHHTLTVSAPFFDDFVCSLRHRARQGEVVLLLRRPDGQVLLHSKSFYPAGVFRLPSGGVLPGESVLDAARREAQEETGLDLRDPRPLGLLSVTFQRGWNRRYFHSWLVLADVEGDPRPGDSGEQISGFRWVPPEALAEVAAQLRALPSRWADWGRFRALAHEVALRWIGTEIATN
ncbi:MAG: NUDIX domain-containing protein [Anaerolineae bacterium]|nr:NUDIX domain-containing protein [Anaerolineae bacterium]MDW8067766.1 NUDIX domain-containing protein [Anaerolineae bacterium]